MRGLGVKVAFVTNNSYRPPDRVVEKLNRLGVKAAEGEVLTSAQAAVRLLGGRDGLDGRKVMVVGGPGLRQALEAAGARLVDGPAWREAEVVAVGFDPDLTYARVRDATLAIRAGARFVGSNPDTTLPTPEGFWPGAGATLALLRASTGVRPEVAGKPERAPARHRRGGHRPRPLPDGGRPGRHRPGRRPPARLVDRAGPQRRHQRWPTCPTWPPRPTISWPTSAGCSTRPARPSAPPPPPSRDAAAGLLGTEGDGERRWLVAVERRGRVVVGAAALRPDGTVGLLDGPVVEEAWRRRLVGTRLVVAACIEARAAGLARVAAPPGAEPFLTRLGFRPGPRPATGPGPRRSSSAAASSAAP